MKTFKLTDKSPNGTSLQEYFPSSYKKLVEKLGEPNSEGDKYKVSTEWILEDEKGNVVTVYDYRETNLYSDGLPSVKKFRALKSYEWHIGATNEKIAHELITWLSK
jgi:hypothetical protein